MVITVLPIVFLLIITQQQMKQNVWFENTILGRMIGKI